MQRELAELLVRVGVAFGDEIRLNPEGTCKRP